MQMKVELVRVGLVVTAALAAGHEARTTLPELMKPILVSSPARRWSLAGWPRAGASPCSVRLLPPASLPHQLAASPPERRRHRSAATGRRGRSRPYAESWAAMCATTQAAICSREWNPSLPWICSRWLSAVRSEMNSGEHLEQIHGKLGFHSRLQIAA